MWGKTTPNVAQIDAEYRDTLPEILGSGVVGTLPNCLSHGLALLSLALHEAAPRMKVLTIAHIKGQYPPAQIQHMRKIPEGQRHTKYTSDAGKSAFFRGFGKGLAGGGLRLTGPQIQQKLIPRVAFPFSEHGHRKRRQKRGLNLWHGKDFLAPTPSARQPLFETSEFPRKNPLSFQGGKPPKRPFSLYRVGKSHVARGRENRGSLISVPLALRAILGK